MKFSVKDFFNKCDQVRSDLRIWSRLLKKSLMENFIFCAVLPKNKMSMFNLPSLRDHPKSAYALRGREELKEKAYICCF